MDDRHLKAKTLVVYIGTGKTGSTSIQQYLLRHKTVLAESGVFYWGLNFEHADTRSRRAWQAPDGTGLLQRLSTTNATEEVSSILNEAVGSLSDGGIAVWCNESIYERPEVFIPLLKACAVAFGLELRVIAYARSRKGYLLSAYQQWGLKHKTYHGPVLSFSEWVRAQHDFLCYGVKLSTWSRELTNSFILVNYDYLPDVVSDFLSRIPCAFRWDSYSPSPKENPSLDVGSMALYALYNNLQAQPVSPAVVSSLLANNGLEGRKCAPLVLSRLYPEPEELTEVEALFADDSSLVDHLLAQYHQPPFHLSQERVAIPSFSDLDAVNGALALLIAIIVKQDRRIKELEARVFDFSSSP